MTKAWSAGWAVVLFAAGLIFADEYKEIEVQGGGTVQGVVKWVGEKPTLEPMPIHKDAACCGGPTIPSPRLRISESGGVANSVVWLVALAQGKKLDSLGTEFLLDQVKCEYVPHVLIVPARREVTMVNSDPILHTVNGSGIKEFNYAFPTQGRKLPEQLKKAGIIRLSCDTGHTWMSGAIHVVAHPYYAVTDAEGRFKLTDVPPGAYKIAMWHEGWKVLEIRKKDGEISGYSYAADVTAEKDVTVPGAGEVAVDFELSEPK